jgi:hypothetical protein
MTLTHTQQSGYIRLDDVYTDGDGVEYTVYQDTDAEDPRLWLTHEEAALVVINADRHTQTDNINDYDDNPVINDLLRTMEQNDIEPGDITPKWWDAYVDSLAERQLPYDVVMTTCHTSQSDWFTVIAAVKDGYGSAMGHIDTFETWARGDVWVVSPDHPDYETFCGIYADSPESAVEEYIDNYRSTHRQLTLF